MVVVAEKTKWKEEETQRTIKKKKSDLCLNYVTVCGLLCLSERDLVQMTLLPQPNPECQVRN